MFPIGNRVSSFITQCSISQLRKNPKEFWRLSSKSSDLNVILDGDSPAIYDHIKELNKKNSELLAKKYDALIKHAMIGGGQRGIERHVKRNKKMLVRDRIKLLLDEKTETIELSPLAGLGMEYGDVPCAGVVTLIGKVHGVLCMVIANDATVKSGSIYPITLKKQLRAQRVARENKLPCIYLVDSGGAFLPKQAEIFNEGGESFYNQAMMSASEIPQTAVVCGSCTAGGAYIPAMADESVILHRTGSIYLGGPPLVYAATGERVTTEQLGGATLHCKVSGVTDHFANTEEEALAIARDVIATLNVQDADTPTSIGDYEQPLYSVNRLNDFAPSKSYGYQVDPHLPLSCILDGSRFHEFKSLFGPTLITGFGFVKGHIAGFLVSNGRLSGSAAAKGSHFVQLCSQRGIPMVFLQHFNKDNASSMHSSINDPHKYEAILKNASFIKAHAQLMQAVACANVPYVAIATGGLIGSLESQALGSLSMGARFQFTYPNVKVGGFEPDQLARDVASEEMGDVDPSLPSFNKRKLELYKSFVKETDAFHATSRAWNDGVILPVHTRDVIGFCLSVFKQESRFSVYSQQKPSIVQPLLRL